MKRRISILLVIGLLLVAAAPLLAQGVQPAWQQSFERGTDGWIGNETAGPNGWCGEVTRHERGSGPVAPAKGQAYAVVEHGECNEHWAPTFGEGSAPYSPLGGYSDSWPQSGHVTEVDIYLDPGWEDGTSFTYASSIRELASGDFSYFVIPVAKDSGSLTVAGHEVSEAGWYTFRFEFGDEDGQVAVDFELADKGRILFSKSITQTLGEVATSSLDTADFGTGYVWFVQISDGLELPIDHSKYRPGK
jgi:hypothetical protein